MITASGSAPGIILGSLQRGVRLLFRQPAFSLPAIAVLGLGLGGLTAVGAVVKALYFSAAPGIALHGDLIWLSPLTTSGYANTVSFLDFQDIAERTSESAETIAFSWSLAHGGANGKRLAVAMVSDNYLRALGVAVRGLTFETSGDDDTPLRAVVSDNFARRTFGDRATVLGQRIRLEQSTFVVIGVAAPGFVGLDITSPTDIFVPSAAYDLVRPGSRGALRRRSDPQWFLAAIPKPGVPSGRVSELAALQWQRLITSYPESHRQVTQLVSFPGRSAVHPLTYAWLPGLLGKLGLVLGLIALAALTGFSSLQTSLWLQRQYEVATRMAVGGASSTILLQCVVESLPLGLLAGLVATGTGSMIVKVLLLVWVPDFTYDLHIPLVASLLIALGATTLVTAAVTGATVRRLMRVPLRTILVEGGSGTTDTHSTRSWRRLILSVQIAVAILVTSLASQVVLRSAAETRKLDASGISDRLALALDPVLDSRNGADSAADTRLARTVQNACAATCSYSSTMPLVDAAPVGFVTLMGRDDSASSAVITVGPAFFQALQLPLLHGRDFADQDLSGTGRGAIVSASLAQAWGIGSEAIGKSMRLGGDSVRLTILGVAPDLAYGDDIARAGQRAIYLPASIATMLADRPLILGADRQALQNLANDLGRLSDTRLAPRRIGEFAADAHRTRAYLVLLTALAALLSVSISLLGSYGNGTLFLATRSRELAIRAALGASRKQLLGVVTYDVARATIEGSAAALLLAAVLGLLIYPDPAQALHLGPIAVMLALLTITTASLLVLVLPAIRSRSIQPASALR